jgi:hypothetical protein
LVPLLSGSLPCTVTEYLGCPRYFKMQRAVRAGSVLRYSVFVSLSCGLRPATESGDLGSVWRKIRGRAE